MDLGSFLADDSLGGSWADEEVDMSSIGVPITSGSGHHSVRREERLYDPMGDQDRRERREYPIPDEPPYRARVGNLPWDINEVILEKFFETRMQAKDIISEIKLPVDISGRLKGFGFVTFNTKELLEESLNLNLTELSGRKLFVNVAAPQKQDVFDLDWRAARSGPPDTGRGKREDVQLDWTSARGSGLPPRQRSERGERGEGRPRREEPDLDWGSARNAQLPLSPRERTGRTERRPRKEEPDLDWGAVRSSAPPPPRESGGPRVDRPRSGSRGNTRPKRAEPELNWGAVRGSSGPLPPKEKLGERRRKSDHEFQWKKGQSLEPKGGHSSRGSGKNPKSDEEKKEQPKPQKSLYDVLAIDSEDDEQDNHKTNTTTNEDPAVSKLEEETAKLKVEESGEGWEVVGNK